MRDNFDVTSDTAGTAPTSKRSVPNARHRGRVLALQVLYEVDVARHEWRQALEMHAEALAMRPSAVEFATSCVEGVTANRERLDAMIARYAPLWPVDQLAAVDKSILRLALFELFIGKGTPPKVAISEAVELAKIYGGENSARFVNGVLGAAFEAAPRTQPPS